MKTVLVTGGAGFIGSAFVRSLAERDPEASIVVLDRLGHAGDLSGIPPELAASERFTFWQGSVNDVDLVSELVSRATVVVHCAAETHVARSMYSYRETFETDVLGTQSVASAVLRWSDSVERVVHLSGSEVYGSSAGPIAEDFALDPVNPYAAAKLGADRLVSSYVRGAGLPATILRPFDTYGPRQHLEKLISRLIVSSLLDEAPVIHGPGDTVRDWVQVGDVVEAIHLALQAPAEEVVGEVFNIGSGIGTSLLEVATLVQRLAEGGRPPVVEEEPMGTATSHVADIAKARKILGFEPSPALGGGLAETVQWYGENRDWWERLAAQRRLPIKLRDGRVDLVLMQVDFYRHDLGEAEIAAATEALRSLFLTTGANNAAFEEGFATYLGVKRAVTTSSATAALHLGLAALGVGPGDEVITTPLSFIATANAILMVGATPVFVDVDPATGLIDPAAVGQAITDRTRAIVPVHLYGQMADMAALRSIADRHDVKNLEDAAHAVEAKRDGVQPGQLGDAAAFSFYATKNLTSGEGGAIATRSGAIADLIVQTRNHGMSASAADRHSGAYRHWDMDRFGWKYNMTNIQAAILLPQLDRIEERLARREAVASRYESAFAEAGIEFPAAVPGSESRSARHLFTVWAPTAISRDPLLSELQGAGVGVAVNYRPIHLTTYYRQTCGFEEGSFPAAESIGARTVSLPLFPGLTDEESSYVIDAVVRVWGSA